MKKTYILILAISIIISFIIGVQVGIHSITSKIVKELGLETIQDLKEINYALEKTKNFSKYIDSVNIDKPTH
jgi:hypothetical protein